MLAALERAPTTSLSLRLPLWVNMLVTLTNCRLLLLLCLCCCWGSCPLAVLLRRKALVAAACASWLSKAVGMGIQVTVPAVGVAGSLLPAEVLALPGRADLAGSST